MNESATTMTPLRLAEMRLRNCYTNREGEEVGVHIVTRDRHEHARDYPIVGTVEMWSELIAHLSKVVGRAVWEITASEKRRAEEGAALLPLPRSAGGGQMSEKPLSERALEQEALKYRLLYEAMTGQARQLCESRDNLAKTVAGLERELAELGVKNADLSCGGNGAGA